jgi:hypothetical protein
MITATANYLAKIAQPVTSVTQQFIITIAGYSRAFTNLLNVTPSGYTGPTLYPWLMDGGPDDYTYSVNDLDGGANVGNLTFTVQDQKAAITGDFPGFVFEGSTVTVQHGFLGLAYADFVTVFVGYIDAVGSVNANLEYAFSCLDFSGYLNQVIYTTADNGGVTSSANIKTLNGNPLSILLSILQTQTGLQLGTKTFPLTMIDFTTINAYIAGPFNGVNFVFHLTQAPMALDFIKQQLLKPLGGYLHMNAAGMLTVRFFYPLAGPVALGNFNIHTFTSVPTAEQSEMINLIETQFDRDDDLPNGTTNYLSQTINEYGPSLTRFGIIGEMVVAADGLRSGFQGYIISLLVARLIFLRYGNKSLMFDSGSADTHLDTCLYESGDLVSVTHAQVPNRTTGTMGITNKLFEITNKKWAFKTGILTFTLIDASYLSTFGSFEIAPSSEGNYASDSTADKATYMFQSSTAGVMASGVAANTLG